MYFRTSCSLFLQKIIIEILRETALNLQIALVNTVFLTILRESFPRYVDKTSKGSGILKEEERTNFFPLHSSGLCNNNLSCLRTVSGLNLPANPIILKCTLWEQIWSLQGLYNNVSCQRTVSGLNLLANSVILKCELWEEVW